MMLEEINVLTSATLLFFSFLFITGNVFVLGHHIDPCRAAPILVATGSKHEMTPEECTLKVKEWAKDGNDIVAFLLSFTRMESCLMLGLAFGGLYTAAFIPFEQRHGIFFMLASCMTLGAVYCHASAAGYLGQDWIPSVVPSDPSIHLNALKMNAGFATAFWIGFVGSVLASRKPAAPKPKLKTK